MTLKTPHHFICFACAVAISIAGCSKNSSESEKPPSRAEPETVPVTPAPVPDSELPDSELPDSASNGNSLYDDALAAMDSGDLDLAFELVRAAKAAAPDDPETTFLMAHVLAERNRFTEAIKLLDDLAVEAPDAKLPVLGQTADWMVISGQWTKAEQRYRMLLELVPDNSMAERQLAQLLLRQGRRQEAAALLRKLCRGGFVEQTNLCTLLRLSFPFVVDASSADSDPIGPLGIARRQISQGEWLDALETLASTDSDDPNRVALIGRIHSHLNDLDGLQQWSDAITEPIATNADYWFAMGQWRLGQKQFAAAAKCFCESVLIDSTDGQAYVLLGQSLDGLKRNSDAMAAKQRAELIESTHEIGQRLSQGGEVDLADVERLVQSLDELRRPFESLAWRTIQIAVRRSRSELSDSEARQAIAAINDQRLQLLQSESAGADDSFVVCGIDYMSLNHLAK